MQIQNRHNEANVFIKLKIFINRCKLYILQSRNNIMFESKMFMENYFVSNIKQTRFYNKHIYNEHILTLFENDEKNLK